MNQKDLSDQLIQARYNVTINYYWDKAKRNRIKYKSLRTCTIVFGALVTLVASLSSSNFFDSKDDLVLILGIATPILAALLTIIGGLSQGFQYGAAWHNMVITAEYLQKEYDLFLVTAEDDRNYQKQAEILNNYIIEESQNFFERILGGAKATTTSPTEKQD